MPFEPLALQSPGASPSSTRRRFWQGGSSTSPIRRARASVVQARGQAPSVAAKSWLESFSRQVLGRVGIDS